MELRQLGGSDVKITPITLGAWAIGGWMWGGQDEADAIAAIDASIDCGITSIDTAAIYGYGASETIVGKAVASKRDQVQLLTKFGLRCDSTDGQLCFKWADKPGGLERSIYNNARPDSVIFECEQSLKRLRTDYIDVFQCHWPDPTTPIDETMSAIDKLLKDGKIRAAGVSNFTAEQIEQACSVVAIASNQPPYSMVNRHIEDGVLGYCSEHGISTIAYSPLQRGLLTGKVTMDRKFPQTDHRSANAFFKPANRQKVLDLLDKLHPIADAHSATLAQLVINWTINQPGITAALVGARNAAQAKENAHAASFELTADETSAINEILESDFPAGWESNA